MKDRDIKAALDRAIMQGLACTTSKHARPGAIIESLPQDVREKLEQLQARHVQVWVK